MKTINKVLYTGVTHTTGGRAGKSQSSDGRLNVTFSPPGSAGEDTNPEQLFAAGWSACFIGAMEIAARHFNVTLPPDHYVDTEVDLVINNHEYTLEARLNISLPGLKSELAHSIIMAAKETCPYSKATRGNIKTTYTLI
ncbi:Ohr family peroxiredoxin [Marinilongibacter aquaticus]|uniref:Ohr family peroxiredoxin n=1 Tax=Marinilongibacter aquaticus TaxID=2975157 RepID=UPI0021BD9306|nr:Ohr family peroxiredoxin [Marinilongibacter aquaticus]UBM60009.1 Ohr family peroxiredoxin [Marinilongibacter aquaticus]